MPREAVLSNVELQKYEYMLCAKYPLFMMLRWIYTIDEMTGKRRLFPNYAHIHRLHDLLHEYQFLGVKKSRRMQVTWWSMGEVIHKAVFMDYARCMVQQLNARNVEFLIKDRAHVILEKLPSFLLRGEKLRKNKELLSMEIRMPWGSIITGVPDSAEGTQLVGYTVTFWYCDEAAIQPNLHKSIAGARAALSGGGKGLFTSSVRPGHFLDITDDVSGSITESIRREKPVISIPFKGVKEWQNVNNGFYIAEIHYSSEPSKDPDTEEGKVWKENERKGYTDLQAWSREMEIDATAMADMLVYPQFDPRIHVVDWKIEDIPDDWTRYAYLDPGIGAQTAVLWCAVCPEGAIYFYDEYYISGLSISANAENIKEVEAENDKKINKSGIENSVRMRRMDPHAFKRQYTGTTPASEYFDAGVDVYPANNDVEAGIELTRIYLDNAKKDDSNPARCYFLPHLSNLFKEFRRYVMNEFGDKPQKGNDHLMDCLRYAIMDQPMYIGKMKVKSSLKEFRNKLTGAIFTYRGD